MPCNNNIQQLQNTQHNKRKPHGGEDWKLIKKRENEHQESL